MTWYEGDVWGDGTVDGLDFGQFELQSGLKMNVVA
jgi:hypothetical protein